MSVDNSLKRWYLKSVYRLDVKCKLYVLVLDAKEGEYSAKLMLCVC